MELAISIILGAWISLGGWLAYRNLKKEYANNNTSDERGANK